MAYKPTFLSDITFSVIKLKYLNEFFNVRKAVYAFGVESGLTEQEATIVAANFEKTTIGSRPILSGIGSDERVFGDFSYIFEGLKSTIDEQSITPSVSFPLEGRFDVLMKAMRGACFELKNVDITSETSFEPRNSFASFGREAYSLALISPELWVSIAAGDSGEGVKGKQSVIGKIVTPNMILIDDVSKYTDVSALLRGMA